MDQTWRGELEEQFTALASYPNVTGLTIDKGMDKGKTIAITAETDAREQSWIE